MVPAVGALSKSRKFNRQKVNQLPEMVISSATAHALHLLPVFGRILGSEFRLWRHGLWLWVPVTRGVYKRCRYYIVLYGRINVDQHRHVLEPRIEPLWWF